MTIHTFDKMKTYNKVIITAILLSFTLSSCEKFLDVNDNPNRPGVSTLPLDAKFPAALVSTVNQETGQLNQIGALWGGYWGTNNDGISTFFDLKTYNGPGIRNQRDGIPVWENGFNNILYFELIKEEATNDNHPFYAGAAKIMQGWLFLRLVDVYNNIPFDEAAKGTDITTPRYESGQVVYEKAINLITDGINELKNAPEIGTISGDILFSGNRSAWAKFGNTIKLRALIRQSEVGDPAYISSEIAKIMQDGNGFLGVGEHAAIDPGYQNTAGKLNPFWESYYQDVQGNATNNYRFIRPTAYLLEQYKQRNDPRIARIYVAVEGEYNGVIFGNPDNNDPQYSSENTSPFKGPSENNGNPTGLFHAFDQPSILLSSFESLFLQAEAAQRGWINGDAKTYYESGIIESFRHLTVPESEFSTYNAQTTVDFNSAADKTARIIEQKWLALNSINSIEAWHDFRRLGLPQFPGTAATGITGRPLRFMYPETERGTNANHAAAQGSDLMTQDRVWWDKN